MESESLNYSWIPPLLPGLVLKQRGEHWLCLNPEGPAWFVTNRAGALLLKLADGSRSLVDIHDLMADGGVFVDIEHIANLFASAKNSLLFETWRVQLDDWGSRKLAAVHLHLTNRCNLECTYCFRESTPRLPVHHSSAHFVDALTRILPFAAPNLTVTFTGGEPLMFPGFETVVTASTKLGYTNVLLTNGILITPERAEFIAEHFSEITISLDGPTEAIHADTRGRGNHKRVLQGINRLADKGANVHVKVTVSPSNLEYCDLVSDVLPDTVPVQITPMMPMGRGQQLHRDFIDSDAFLGLSRGLARTTDGRLSNSYVPGRKATRCHAGISNVSIDDTGDVYPCHLFHQDQFRLGNIFTQSFDEIFFGQQNHDYVDAMDVEANNDVCRSCEVRFLCGGGCKANTLHSIGDFRGVDRYCGYLKDTIFDDLFGSCGVEADVVERSVVEGTSTEAGKFLGMPLIVPPVRSSRVTGGAELSTSL